MKRETIQLWSAILVWFSFGALAGYNVGRRTAPHPASRPVSESLLQGTLWTGYRLGTNGAPWLDVSNGFARILETNR